MDDSDDYGFDEFELDEETLAILDQEEQKYLLNLNKPPDTTRALAAETPDIVEEPVNKRYKTDTGWKSRSGAHYALNDDYDDLPEISVSGDGSYGIRTTGAKQTSERNVYERRTIPSIDFASGQPPSCNRPPLGYKTHQVPYAQGNPNILPKPAIQSSSKKSNGQEVVNYQKSHQLESHVQGLEKKLEEVRESLFSFLIIVMSQLFSQLREANVRTESALKEAVERKLAKEGEVTILRKTIEKVNKIANPNIAMLISFLEFSKPRGSNSPT